MKIRQRTTLKFERKSSFLKNRYKLTNCYSPVEHYRINLQQEGFTHEIKRHQNALSKKVADNF